MRNSASSAPTSSSKTPCCTKVGLKRGPWKPEEDELLANYINKEGEGRWRTLPKRAGLLRCGKSCRLRWMNYLRPSVKRGQIAPDEEDLILRLHRLLGNRWSLIAGRIPGRTDNEIKNYWNTHLSKKLISQGIDPRTHKPLNPNPNSTSDIVHVPAPKVSKPNFNHNPNPNPSLHTTGLEEITNKGKECFKRRHLDQDPLLVVGDGDEDWQNSDGLNSDGLNSDGLMMDSQGNSNEEDDTNYCTDDVFSSFLNSLINEDVFVNQQQLQQQQPMGIAPSDPLVPSGQTLGYGVVWEAALTSSTAAAFNEDEHKRFVGRQ